MAKKLQHGDSLYQVIEKVNSLLDGTVKPGSTSIAGSTGSGSNNALQDMIYAEQSRAEQVEQSLQEQIDTLNSITGASDSDGDEEDTEGATAETQDLQPALIVESIRATMAEDTLQTNIDTEEIRAQTAEQANATAISNEVTRATAAEQSNATAISNDITRATTAEQSNATAISNEITRATTAEQNLQDQINAISGALDGTKQSDRFSSTVAGATEVYVDCYRRYGVVTLVIGGAINPSQIAQNTTVTITTIATKYRPPTPMYLSFTGVLGGEVAACNAQGTTDVAFGIRVTINADGTVTIWHRLSGYLGWLSPSKCVTFPAWD